MNSVVEARLQDHVEALANTVEYLQENDVLMEIAERCNEALQSGKKILLCGNGGSAADSQHIAAEIVGRFQKERHAMPALALTTDTSILTAVGNDYGFDQVYSRQIEGLGNMGDVLIAYSTSGNSENIIRAVEAARGKRMHTIGFLGKDGGKLKDLCDISFVVPHDVTARIQEMHLLAGHIVCELLEHDL